MKIRALLPPEAIIVRADVQTKEAAIDLLAELHDQVGHLSDKEAYERDVWKREGECVTAIGMGMAVPHAKSDAVKQGRACRHHRPRRHRLPRPGRAAHPPAVHDRCPRRRRPAFADPVQPDDPSRGGGAPGTAGAGGYGQEAFLAELEAAEA